MAGVLGIYGLIIAVIIGNAVKPMAGVGARYSDYSAFTGFAHLAAGLCCGCARAAHTPAHLCPWSDGDRPRRMSSHAIHPCCCVCVLAG